MNPSPTPLASRLVLAASGAAALALSYSFASGWPGCLVALALVWAAAAPAATSARTFFWGWLAGTLIHLLGFTWILHTLRVFGGLGVGLAGLGLLLFSLAHGLLFGLWTLAVRAGRRLGLPAWVAFPMAYVPLEWLFPKLFPWHLGAPLFHLKALLQIADLTGAWGLTFLAALLSGALVDAWQASAAAAARHERPGFRDLRGLLVAAACLVAATGYGLFRLRQMDRLLARADREGRTVTVGIVQPNIGNFEKEDPAKAGEQLERLATLSRKALDQGAQLVVWPETAIRFPVQEAAARREIAAGGRPGDPPAVAGQPGLRQAWLLAGAILETSSGDENAALLLSPEGGVAGLTAKRVLLAFGEYLPLERRFPWLRRFFPRAGRLVPGRGSKVLDWFGIRLGVVICYEAILPALVQSVVGRGAHVLVNLTNDSWFGPTREPEQHLLLAALRTVETRRALIRATNTGKSAIVDPAGRVRAASGIFQPAVLVQPVPLLAGRSFYVRFGPWLPLGLALLWPVALGTWLWRRRRARRGEEAREHGRDNAP